MPAFVSPRQLGAPGTITSNMLETDRLRFRAVTTEDLDFLCELFSDAEMMKHYPGLRTREQTRAWITFVHESYKKFGHGKWILEQKSDGQRVGQAGLVMTEIDGHEEVELGYFLHRKHWGKGYATESATALAKLAFEKFAYPEIVSAISPANLPSVRVAQRLGMKKVKTSTASAGGYSWLADVYVLKRT